jgi:spore coat protein U-like protein
VKSKLTWAAAAGLAVVSMAASATAVDNTFQARIVIQDACLVNLTAPTTLDFGTNGVLSANVDTSSVVTLTCATSTAYSVSLDAGANPSSAGDVATRRMKSGSNYVGYQMYTDSSRSDVWGTAVGDLVAGTGNGIAQTLTVYGRVPAQTTPPAGTYTDTVTVTVTY